MRLDRSTPSPIRWVRPRTSTIRYCPTTYTIQPKNDRKWQPMEKQQIFKVNLKWLQLNDRWKEETSTASSYKQYCCQEKFNYLNQTFRYRIGQRIRKQNSENKIQRRNEDFKNLNLLKTVWLIIITHDVNHIPWLYFSSLSLFTLINVQFLALIHQ